MAKTKTSSYEYEVFPPGTLQLKDVSFHGEDLPDERYEKELRELQEEAFELQIQAFLKKRRAIFAFEGWDAAGKGGAIRRLTAQMDPRGYKVWPIAAPRDAEVRHHYLWRFWTRLPEQGEVGIFDRTWYGRVLVERVEGFAKPEEWRRAYEEINAFEHTLTSDGVSITKLFLHIDAKTQLKRFKAREKDAAKKYKLGPDDWRNRGKRKQYEKAIAEMLDRTHRPDAPWILVPANDKRFARVFVLRTCVAALRALVKG